jgi:hypothetical protein
MVCHVLNKLCVQPLCHRVIFWIGHAMTSRRQTRYIRDRQFNFRWAMFFAGDRIFLNAKKKQLIFYNSDDRCAILTK